MDSLRDAQAEIMRHIGLAICPTEITEERHHIRPDGTIKLNQAPISYVGKKVDSTWNSETLTDEVISLAVVRRYADICESSLAGNPVEQIEFSYPDSFLTYYRGKQELQSPYRIDFPCPAISDYEDLVPPLSAYAHPVDFYLKFTQVVMPTVETVVSFREQDALNYYYARVTGAGDFSLGVVQAGVDTPLQAVGLAVVAGDEIIIEVDTNVAVGYVNGVQIWTDTIPLFSSELVGTVLGSDGEIHDLTTHDLTTCICKAEAGYRFAWDICQLVRPDVNETDMTAVSNPAVFLNEIKWRSYAIDAASSLVVYGDCDASYDPNNPTQHTLTIIDKDQGVVKVPDNLVCDPYCLVGVNYAVGYSDDAEIDPSVEAAVVLIAITKAGKSPAKPCGCDNTYLEWLLDTDPTSRNAFANQLPYGSTNAGMTAMRALDKIANRPHYNEVVEAGGAMTRMRRNRRTPSTLRGWG